MLDGLDAETVAERIAPDVLTGAQLVPHLLPSEPASRQSTPAAGSPAASPRPPPRPLDPAPPHTMSTPVEPLSESESEHSPSPSHPHSSDEEAAIGSPLPPSVLRRSISGVVVGSKANIRITEKQLRFTAAGETTGKVSMRDVNHEQVVYPGKPRRARSTYYMTEPATPNLSETADRIRRTISLASLDQLMALQYDQQRREQLFLNVRAAGRDLVWRDKDEKRLYPPDAERAIILALKRGLRSFFVAFSVRSGVNVLLLIFRSLRKKRLRWRHLRQAMIGEESLRFGAMIGTFTFLNTLTLHLLRLAPPFSYIRRRIRAGLFSRATFGPPEREGDEGEHRWHAAVAGAVGSLGLLLESASRRTSVAQQLFVRGLQGCYNQYAPALGINIPHGDVLLFGLCCGQIMFAFLLAPDTIPRDYRNWIQGVSGVPLFAVEANRTAVRNNYISPNPVQRALASKGVTERNAASLKQLLANIEAGVSPNNHIPCAVLHPWSDSCVKCASGRFITRFRFMLPVYGALHLIPMLVFRRHQVMKTPLRMLLKAAVGITRSCSFLALFIVIYQALFCSRTKIMDNIPLPKWLYTLLRRKENFWFIGFMTCLSLFAEEKKRRAELAMYCLPRALESAWSIGRRRAWVPIVPFGETMLGAAAMAMIMDAYKHQPKSLSGMVRGLLYQLVGPV